MLLSNAVSRIGLVHSQRGQVAYFIIDCPLSRVSLNLVLFPYTIDNLQPQSAS
jgi:hypothetical protein